VKCHYPFAVAAEGTTSLMWGFERYELCGETIEGAREEEG